MKHAIVGVWCAVFGLSFYYGTASDSVTAIVWGGGGMALSAYQLALIALWGKK